MDMNRPDYNLSQNEVLERYSTFRTGLSPEEARNRLERYGENKLAEGRKKTALEVFIDQFKDLIVWILIAAAVISILSGQGESSLVIFAVLILNAVLGTVQYLKAEKSLESLKAMSSPSATLLRGGIKVQVPSPEVVPGDILLLEAGDLITADARILESWSVKINESSLTGESEAVEKTADVIPEENVALGDRKNMVFSGSLVTYGRATAVVTATGMQTELGHIASLLDNTRQRKTPLQENLNKFSEKLAIAIIAICGVVFLLSYFRSGMGLLDSLMFAVALAVAAIPEALSSIVTIVLAIGTQKMARQNAIIKELKAVESLGAVSVICSDKTGTLTQNRMTVEKIYADGKLCDGCDLELANDAQRLLLKTALLASDATHDAETGTSIGDPTEVALVLLGENFGVEESAYRSQHQRLGELAFDSDRKLMTTLQEIEGVPTLMTKGAIDVLLARSDRLMTSEGVRELTEADREEIMRVNNSLSEEGLRVLAFGYRELDCVRELSLDDEQGYVFIGLISMIDPPRPESVAAVADAKRAGIRTVMITGDHKVTATAIAKRIGIFGEGDLAVSGPELEQMTDEELDRKLTHIAVYARVSPEHKIRIVTAWQRRGQIVAMTGDGVNDAPALKRADVGIAMGIKGTEVTKEAADMVLTDDNFATIARAVHEGRRVYDNLKKTILFVIPSNIAQALLIIIALLAGNLIPLTPVLILWMNMATSATLSFGLAFEAGEKDIMNRPPRKANLHVMDGYAIWRVVFVGLMIAISAFVLEAWLQPRGYSAEFIRTVLLQTLVTAQWFYMLNCRVNDGFSLSKGLLENKGIWIVSGVLLALQLLIIYAPFMQMLFGTEALPFRYWVITLLIGFVMFLIVEAEKVLTRRWRKTEA